MRTGSGAGGGFARRAFLAPGAGAPLEHLAKALVGFSPAGAALANDGGGFRLQAAGFRPQGNGTSSLHLDSGAEDLSGLPSSCGHPCAPAERSAL